MKKNRYKNLFGNMALFTLGNFVSKVLVMLLVPLYTNVLTTAEYGRADVMQTTLLLLVPLLTMNAGEAALRFGLERTSERGSILRTMLRTIAAADIVVVALCGAGYFFLRLALKTLPFGAAYSQSGLMSPHLYFLFFELLFIQRKKRIYAVCRFRLQFFFIQCKKRIDFFHYAPPCSVQSAAGYKA